jgi:hypothetical protein
MGLTPTPFLRSVRSCATNRHLANKTDAPEAAGEGFRGVETLTVLAAPVIRNRYLTPVRLSSTRSAGPRRSRSADSSRHRSFGKPRFGFARFDPIGQRIDRTMAADRGFRISADGRNFDACFCHPFFCPSSRPIVRPDNDPRPSRHRRPPRYPTRPPGIQIFCLPAIPHLVESRSFAVARTGRHTALIRPSRIPTDLK